MQADLERAQRLIRRTGDEIDPQFRIASPQGDFWIAMTLSHDETERAQQMALLSDFMALKLAPAFVMAAEIAEPDAVSAVGFTVRGEFAGAVSMIGREPLRFSAPMWLARDQVGEDLAALLPRGSRALSAKRIAELEAMFGPSGRFPAVKLSRPEAERLEE